MEIEGFFSNSNFKTLGIEIRAGFVKGTETRFDMKNLFWQFNKFVILIPEKKKKFNLL